MIRKNNVTEIKWMFYIFTILAFLLAPNSVIAQTAQEKLDLIRSSQEGSSPLFFQTEGSPLSLNCLDDFANPSEFFVRDGLPNFFNKMKKGNDVAIGYLGGSITRAPYMYRIQSLQYIQQMYPEIKVTGLNAGISGTGADLGACRLYDQLLRHNPDLIFIEFAVNRAYPEGVEGIIRQIWQHDPTIDICLIYTISSGQGQIYTTGRVPDNIINLENLAEHYSIPSVHMGLQSGFLEEQGKLIWKGDPETIKDQIVFSTDGLHPLKPGGDLYAHAIARAMLKMRTCTETIAHLLPKPLLPDNWEDAKMLDPLSFATFEGDWKKLDITNNSKLKAYSDWFPYIMQSEKPGSSFSFQFEGEMFGLFDVGGPEAGQIEIEINGKPASLQQVDMENYIQTNDGVSQQPINRFNRYCNDRYRGQCFFVKVNPGKHNVKIILSPKKVNKKQILGKKQLKDINENPKRYNKTDLYLGKILIRGAID